MTNERFTVTADTVLDNRTNLVWQRAVSNSLVTFAEATVYAKSLRLEGYTDWRLPTKDELLSIIEDGQCKFAIDETTFPYTPSGFFWHSSPFATYFKTPRYQVFCVRGPIIGRVRENEKTKV